MPTVAFSPIGNGFQFFTDAGLPLSGGLLWTYLAGTTTPVATYTTSAGSVAHSNPIVLGPDGRLPAELWFAIGSAYKLTLLDSLSNPIDSWDNLTGINDFNNLTLSGNLVVNGNTTLGNAATDLLTIAPNTVTWSNNPTHSGNHAWSGTQTFNGVSTFTVTAIAAAGIKPGNVAQADVATLDWYQEGTFTPVVTFGGAAVGVTYNINTGGTYTRIGNTVFFKLRMRLSNKGASAGAASIGGLPFASSSSEFVFAVQALSMAGLTGALGATSVSASITVPLTQSAAAGYVVIDNTNFTNTSDVYVTGHYSV